MSEPQRIDLSKDTAKNGLNTSPSHTNKYIDRISSVANIFDGPATFFRNILSKTRKDYPYYHRKYNRVPTVDECPYQDFICLFEANEQYMRDRKVDKFITEILGNRVEECFIREGNLDGHSKCRQLKEEHEIAMTNYYVKYGDLADSATVIDAYMKQKHRLIWQRRNPDRDIVGFGKMQEKRAKEDELHRSYADNPVRGF